MSSHPPAAGGWRQQVRKPFQILDRFLNAFERTVLIVATLAMAACAIAGVISRNLGASLTFVDEVAQLLVVVVTFVGLGHGVRNARHIRVSAVHDLLPEKAQKGLLILISFTTCLLLFALGVFSIDYIEKLAKSGRVMPSIQTPLYLLYSVVPLGLFVGSAQYLLAGVRNIISRENYLSWTHKDEYEEVEELDLGAGGYPGTPTHWDDDDKNGAQGGQQ
ncbi:TRAP transporter small permease [Marinobacteraceae bacterium S3BR75-40.1]